MKGEKLWYALDESKNFSTVRRTLMKLSFPISTALIILSLSQAHCQTPEVQALNSQQQSVQKALSQQTSAAGMINKTVADLYKEQGYRLIWLSNGMDARVESLRACFAAAEEDGLPPARYLPPALTQSLSTLAAGQPLPEQELASTDVALTRSTMQFASDLFSGYAKLPAVNLRAAPLDMPASLRQLISAGDPAQIFPSFRPRNPAYAQLRQSLAYLKSVAAQGGWPLVPSGPKLEPGKIDDRVPSLRAYLAATGDLPQTSASGDKNYDPILLEGVKKFQARHGLDPDGIIGPVTTAQMNTPAEFRMKQVVANMERWRWVPRDFGPRYLAVNIPEFYLRVYDNGQKVEEMKVIVGEEIGTKTTPLFSENMAYIIFNPYWNIPTGIASKEIIPKERSQPGYLAKNNYQIVTDYGSANVLPVTSENLDKVASGKLLLHEPPGKNNSLGQIKFIFPNAFSVYLHDTNRPDLFTGHERARRHGCVRIEKPVALAALLLGDQGITPATVQEILNAKKPKKIDLRQPLPVYMLYWTAFSDDTGVMNFRRDLYNVDQKVLASLKR